MRSVAGAILLIGVLVVGPDRTGMGWGALTGACIGLGILLILVGLVHDGPTDGD